MSGYREGSPVEIERSQRLVGSIMQAMSDEADRICEEDDVEALAIDVALSALVCIIKSMARGKLSPKGCKDFWNNMALVAAEEYTAAVANEEFMAAGPPGNA